MTMLSGQPVGVDPHAKPAASFGAMLASFWRHRGVIWRMARREVHGRYKGAAMGLAWSFITPVLMLAVYTFVFAVIFKARWGIGGDESRAQFAVVLFVGMIVHAVFAEVVNRAPGLIVANTNFVKRVVFPIEVLPIVAMGSALFHALVSTLVLLVAFLLFNGYLHGTALLFPVVLLPLLVLTIGFAWLFASLGVFVRDIGQTTAILTTVMMFLAPVFYPVDAIPEQFRPAIMANPLTFIIGQARDVLVFGRMPDWIGLALYMAVALLIAWLGFAWFQKTRKGFADVL